MFYLYLCQRGYQPAPTSILGLRPSPLLFYGRFGLVGCDAFKDSVSERDGALSAIDPATSACPAPLRSTFKRV
jgi:hypothetical protein